MRKFDSTLSICAGFVTFFFEYRWSCLGIRLAHVARENVDFNAETAVILTGRYVETAVSDSSVLLYSTPVTI